MSSSLGISPFCTKRHKLEGIQRCTAGVQSVRIDQVRRQKRPVLSWTARTSGNPPFTNSVRQCTAGVGSGQSGQLRRQKRPVLSVPARTSRNLLFYTVYGGVQQVCTKGYSRGSYGQLVILLGIVGRECGAWRLSPYGLAQAHQPYVPAPQPHSTASDGGAGRLLPHLRAHSMSLVTVCVPPVPYLRYRKVLNGLLLYRSAR